jgi:ribosomal protein S18 acetylase RimI-like enzyme
VQAFEPRTAPAGPVSPRRHDGYGIHLQTVAGGPPTPRQAPLSQTTPDSPPHGDTPSPAPPQPPPLQLRAAVAADAEPVAALVNSAYRGDSSRVGWTTEADLLDGQRTDAAALGEYIVGGETAGDRVLLLHEHVVAGPVDGSQRPRSIDACVQLDRRGDTAYLGMFTVRPALQGDGLGRRLLRAAELDARRRWGVTAIVMTVIAQRRELIAWYERRGYQATGETAPFPYGDPRFGVPRRPDLRFVVLRKVLTD